MKTSSCRLPTPSERSAWGREAAEDEARWERQLRQLYKHVPSPAAKPVPKAATPAPAGPVTRRVLELVDGVARFDILLTSRTLPLVRGADPEDLVCGECAATLCSGTSLQSARREHPDDARLLARCTCRALNLLYRPAAWRGRKGWGSQAGVRGMAARQLRSRATA